MPKPTIQDVAALAKVSVSTVSRVLNDHPAVSKKAREQVLEVIESLNYRPNKLARSLSSDGFDAILISYARSSKFAVDNPYFNIIVNSIGEVAEEHGYDLILQSSTNQQEEVTKTLSMIADKLIKGVILLSSRVDDILIEALGNTDIPVAVVGKYVEKSHYDNIFSVDTDNFKDSLEACKYLIRMGHTKIGCIHAPKNHYVSLDRIEGISSALQEYDIEIDEDLFVDGGHTVESAYDAALRLLCVRQDVTAIFATDDIKALGIYQAAKQLSISIPEQLSVIGYNDYTFSKMLTPPLTSVKVPVYDLGIVSATKLFAMIKKGLPESNCMLPTELKIRSSVVSKAEESPVS
ncbi:LacI family DNA-binding transcriptional regulator [Paenibacillus sp. OV219]|uniref:LacI family DNA-binding transcriptional regulator n=1 Tax=Paenibacillus sp. OV219 TaxID=1884377 RepID=UPI0008B8E8EF|nr:LacI family DNA-binding transcriptional regulator [Paenibacillus sp. OV219]SEO12280.1 transcriptional regulator, LacI family [Paenibacillus sp. OV219]